jgi:hypothetical protein
MSDLRKAVQAVLEAYDQHDPLGVVMEFAVPTIYWPQFAHGIE